MGNCRRAAQQKQRYSSFSRFHNSTLQLIEQMLELTSMIEFQQDNKIGISDYCAKSDLLVTLQK
jgi:hypothetical protein